MFDLYIGKETAPLSKEEQSYQLAKAKNGDIEARNYLITHNIRLIIHIVTNKFKDQNHDLEDLISVGTIGLIKAIDTYKEEKGIFASYASACIYNEILMYLRKNKRHNNNQSLEDSYIELNKNTVSLLDILANDDDISENYNEKEQKEIINKLVSFLPPQIKEIIVLYFGFFGNKRHTQKEISQIIKKHQSTVSKSISKGVEILKKQLIELGVIEIRQNNTKKQEITIK